MHITILTVLIALRATPHADKKNVMTFSLASLLLGRSAIQLTDAILIIAITGVYTRRICFGKKNL